MGANALPDGLHDAEGRLMGEEPVTWALHPDRPERLARMFKGKVIGPAPLDVAWKLLNNAEAEVSRLAAALQQSEDRYVRMCETWASPEVFEVVKQDAERLAAALQHEVEAANRDAAMFREMAKALGVEVGGGPRDAGVSSFDLPERLLAALQEAQGKAALADRYRRIRSLFDTAEIDDDYDALTSEEGEQTV